MSHVSNSKGKGYCLVYLLMGIFFLCALVFMLYCRNSQLDFPK